MNIRCMKVTPEMAQRWLKLNTKNRKLREGVVKKYAADMRAGRWVEANTDPIVFNTENVLENGQHRLHAIVASGATVQMLVISNAESAMGTFDIGAGRSTADYLTIRGGKADQRVIAAVRYILRKYGFSAPSNATIESYMRNHEEYLETAVALSMIGHQRPICKKAACAVAAYAALRCGVPDVKIRDFFEVANTGFMHEQWQTAPIILRNAMTGYQRGGVLRVGGENVRTDIHALSELAIKDFANRYARKKSYTTNMPLPFFPVLESMDAEEAQALLG